MVMHRTDIGKLSHGQLMERPFISSTFPVTLILLFSLVLNLWGNRWGLPDLWHPDEGIMRSARMVDDRTLNPHFFAYGGLHYYAMAVVAVVPTKVYAKLFDPIPVQGKTEREEWNFRQITRMGVIARSLSAVVSAILCGITIYVAFLLFQDLSVGLVAATFLCVAMSFVAIAHFATVDATANFLFWLSCLLALMSWIRGKSYAILAASFVAGLAFGTKIDRLFVVLPLFFAYLFSGQGTKKWRMVCAIFILMVFGFLLANPIAIFYPIEFLDGSSRDLFFNSLRKDYWSSDPHLTILMFFREGLGTSLSLLVLVAGIFGGYKIGKNHGGKVLVWLLSTFVPSLLLLFSTKFIKTWYVAFYFPPLMITAGYGCIDFIRRMKGVFKSIAIIAVLTIWGISFLYSIELLRQFTHDARYAAKAWIDTHVPPGSSVGISGDLMDLSHQNYKITRIKDMEFSPFLLTDLKRLEENSRYQTVRRTILQLEHWAGRHLGTSVRKEPYRAWFDEYSIAIAQEVERLKNVRDKKDSILDFLVSVGDANSKVVLNREEYQGIYSLHAEFMGKPMISFVNPTIRIFKKTNGSRS